MSERRAPALAPRTPPPPWTRGPVPALVLAAAGLAAYWNSFAAPFLFDDLPHIRDNPGIRRLIPPWDALSHTSRPLVQLSMAINYAIGGLDPRGYHAVNLAIHLLAALALFAVIRRALVSPALAARFGAASSGLALAAALLWVVHPLHTEAVTYTIQRAESLAGLLLLAALLCLIRAADAGRPLRWSLAAVLVTALGMATKPVMATAPLVALLYDRAFLAGSFRESLRRRRGLYAGMTATLGLLPALLAQAPNEWKQSAGFAVKGITPLAYALTEPAVLLHYLKLAVWPHPLILDYLWPITGDATAAWPAALVVAALLAGAIWALVRAPALGFACAWPFLILAPTSSVIPIVDAAFEHRMYLPLASLCVLAVVGGYELVRAMEARHGGRRPAARAAAVAALLVGVAALGAVTVLRNRDYRSKIAIWSATAAARPQNARARFFLGSALADAGRLDEAEAAYRETLRLRPDYADAWSGLGHILAERGDLDAAIEHYRRALHFDPRHEWTHCDLGVALARQGRLDEAVAELEEALVLSPNLAQAHLDLGLVLARMGRLDEAIVHDRAALAADPGLAQAHLNLGAALAQLDHLEEAVTQFESALRLAPDYAEAHYDLGLALARLGRVKQAAPHLERALELRPDDPRPRALLDELRGAPTR